MRERKLQVVEKRGKLYARTTYVGVDGKRHALWRAGRHGTEAKKRLQAALDELKNDDGAISNAKKTFRELADWYTKRYLIPPEYRDGRIVKGKRSWQSETYLLKAIRVHFDGYKLRSITHGELERFKEIRLDTPTKKGPRTIASVNRELMVIRAMLRKAQREGWLLRVPFEERDPLISMADERQRERTLSYSEEDNLLAVCVGPRKHLKPIIICAVDTGMRLGEILKLNWDEVDFKNEIISILSTNTKTLKTRKVPMTPRLLVELKELQAKAKVDADRVFGTKTNVKRSFKTACELAGIPHGGIDGLTFHCLRHTAGTRMAKRGMKSSVIGRILGHSQESTTYRYISADDDVINEARDALAFRPPRASARTES